MADDPTPDFRRLHPRLTSAEAAATPLPFLPELTPVINPQTRDGLATRPWLDWARRLTLLVQSLGPGTPGPPGLSSSVFPYRADAISQAANDPGAGKLRWNATPQNTATALYFDWLTSEGFDTHLLFQLMTVSSRFIVQDADLAEVYQVWEMTGPSINHPDWFEVPVTFVESQPPGHDFSHNTNLAVLLGTTVGPHHATHEPGGTDALVNAAWTNDQNSFTQNQFIEKDRPALFLRDTAQLHDSALFTLLNRDAVLQVKSLTGGGADQATPLTAHRNGNVTVGTDLTVMNNATVIGNATVNSSAGNVACKNQANVFTQNQELNSAVPQIVLVDTTAPANARRVALLNYQQGLYLQTQNDAGGGPVNVFYVTAGGSAVANYFSAAAEFYEKGRATPLGHWIAFTPTLLAAAGTVTAAVNASVYTLIGKTLFLNYYGQVTPSTPTIMLYFVLPGGLVPATYSASPAVFGDREVGVAQATPGDVSLRIYHDAAGVTNFTAVSQSLSINAVIQVQ